MDKVIEDKHLCNMCGHTCILFVYNDTEFDSGIDQNVYGKYHSTAGNGYGAFDDNDIYHIRLCEFCLDWIFSICKIPITVLDDENENKSEYIPAEVRVMTQEWRKDKETFYKEFLRRTKARDQAFNNNAKASVQLKNDE